MLHLMFDIIMCVCFFWYVCVRVYAYMSVCGVCACVTFFEGGLFHKSYYMSTILFWDMKRVSVEWTVLQIREKKEATLL